MSSAVDICNIALSHIGSDAIVSSIDPADGSVESGQCARFYPIARQSMIEIAAPNFAKTRVALAEVANTSTIWAYAYAKPTACLRPLRIFTLQAGLTVFTQDDVTVESNEEGGALFTTEGEVIYTNEAEAVLSYLTDIIDTTKFTPMFVTGLGFLLASFLAGPIIKGTDGATVGNTLYKRALEYVRAAAVSDANAGATTHGRQQPAHLSAR